MLIVAFYLNIWDNDARLDIDSSLRYAYTKVVTYLKKGNVSLYFPDKLMA